MLERRFELRSEKGLWGELRFEPGGTAYGTVTLANSAKKKWTFRATGGILKPRVIIRETGTDEDAAVFWYKHWGGGWAEFVQGSKIYWKSASFWGTGRGFYNGNGERLLEMKPKFFSLLKTRHDLKLETRCVHLEELPLLLVLAGYLCAIEGFAS